MSEENVKKEVAQEEKKYREALGLKEAADLILRFERKEAALKSAAKKFASIPDYQDAAEQAEECLRLAQKAAGDGSREVYESAREKQQSAQTKSDYIDAIAEFKRVWKREELEQPAGEGIASCKEQIIRLENRATWKKRFITLAVLVVLVLIYIRTDAYPFTKGLVHQQMGNYRQAMANYKEGIGVPWSEGKIKKCHYYLGMEYLKKDQKKKALSSFRKADNALGASKEAAKLEIEHMAGSQVGERIRFGKCHWNVLDNTGKEVYLLYQGEGNWKEYAPKEAKRWEDSNICKWLNTTFINRALWPGQQEVLVGEVKKNSAVTLLSSTEYQKYRESLEPFPYKWWLRDAGDSRQGAGFVDEQGQVCPLTVKTMKCKVRPAIRVKLK